MFDSLNIIVFLNEYPTLENRQDGYFRRVDYIDNIFKKSLKIYVNIQDNIYCNEVIKLTENIYQINLIKSQYKHDFIDLINQQKVIVYAHSIYRLDNVIAKQLFENAKMSIIDFHGCVPEEEKYKNISNLEYYTFLNEIELFTVQNADILICVSSNMKEHISNKYQEISFDNKELVLLPILGTVTNIHSFEKLKNEKKTIIYSGGTQKWQQVEKMLNFINEYEKYFNFIFLVHDINYIEDKYKHLFSKEFPGELKSVLPEEVSNYYKNVHYGLVLREDIIVNNLSSPTKLSEYLGAGVIPIVDSKNIGDFKNLGYKTIDVNNFEDLSDDIYISYVTINMNIYDKIKTIIFKNSKLLQNKVYKENVDNPKVIGYILSLLSILTFEKNKLIDKRDKIIQEKDQKIQEKDQKIQEKDQKIQEKDQKLIYEKNDRHDKEVHIQNQNNEIIHWQYIAQSMRIKNRIKRAIKIFIPNKIWKVLKYAKHNPASLRLGIHTLKTQGAKVLVDKISKIDILPEDKVKNGYRYIEAKINKNIIKELNEFDCKPLISIIIPVYNVDPKWLDLAIKSIENQWYQNWELCIVDDKSTNKKTLKYLKSLNSAKIKIKLLEKNINISAASNDALTLVTGEYVVLMDNDDELTSDALYEVVKAINTTGADFIYSDEDKLEMDGTFSEPHFKPDFAPDMLLSQNYISHLGVIKKILIDKVGGFSIGLEGAQDYDLYLKVLEHTNKITHISKVLYHWRKIPGSTASNFDDKSYAQESGVKSLKNAMRRRNLDTEVLNGKYPGTYRVKYKIIDNPLVSIIIPFKDKPELLTMCIESILNKTTYENFEVIGISNNSEEKDTFNEIERLSLLDNRIKFYEYNVPFNYSDINNHAVNTHARGEQILLLNNDIEIISNDWIESMIEHSQREEVGVVGSKLYYPNDRIQHAGVVIGIGGIAGHSHKYLLKETPGYFSRLNLIQNVSAVTAACFMVKKSIFQEMDGLNEKELKVAFNDIDFCLRVREKGYRNIFTPYCEAYHHESISRGHEDTAEKQKRFSMEVEFMENRHSKILEDGDPYYNRNLTLDRENFSLC